MVALLAAWWLTFAPTGLGGPAGYVIVNGTSMQPLLHTGDLVITHRQSGYHVGDLVVVHVDGGSVVHRLHDGNARTGWHTKGDNRQSVDSWVVHPNDIVGKAWLTIPRFSTKLSFLSSRWAAPTAAALVAFLLLLPKRRRRNARLDAVLAKRCSTPWTRATPLVELATFVFASLCALVSIAVAWIDLHAETSVSLALPLSALAVTGCVALVLGARLFVGLGLPEPRRSFARFGSEVIDVSVLPEPDIQPIRVRSRTRLLHRAHRGRVPIVHVDDGPVHRFVVFADDDVIEYVAESTPTSPRHSATNRI